MSERPRIDLTGVVLCGGKSLRMGADKAALRVSGSTLLENAARELARVATETLLACGPTERYRDLGWPLVLDAYEDGGPLAGLEAGLSRAQTEWIAALACDMPRAQPAVFLALLERAEERGLDACFLATAKGVEPLCAVYRRTCLAPMREALAAGERKVTSFLRYPKSSGVLPSITSLAESELPDELAASGVALNLNTPEDLRSELLAKGGIA